MFLTVFNIQLFILSFVVISKFLTTCFQIRLLQKRVKNHFFPLSMLKNQRYFLFQCNRLNPISKCSCTFLFYKCFYRLFNPFPHIDASRYLCSRRHFEKIVTKEKIAQNKQFLLLPQFFQLFFSKYTLINKDYPYFCPNVSKVVCFRFVVCAAIGS